MAGMQFEYDEEGGTFYYFLLSFVALVLFPATYYLWPRRGSKDDQRKRYQCHCEPCQIKRQNAESHEPKKKFQKFITKVILIIGWIFFIYIAYKTSQVELEFKEFDPFAELEIERGASVADIKKAYRRLSLIYHPDRETGDSHKFMKITKAHDALTDDEARKNWEEYGNPDGPGATQVGIALPKWIVEKQNSIWVLGIYALIFMIILPVCVGTWWYRSIKYSAQQVLIETTKMFYTFLRKSPNMILKRVIVVLSGSYEFCKKVNNEIQERPSDNTEVPELIRDLPKFIPNVREVPFCIPYSMKARALLVAHFSSKQVSKSLEEDKQYIIKKCPYLLMEMLDRAHQLSFIAQGDNNLSYKLHLDTVDNIMKVCQMVIQGLWNNKSPLLQLPHITEDMLRHFITKKRSIRSIKDFAGMSNEDRRALLRQLSDGEYQNVMTVLAMIPYNVEMNVTCEVKGEQDRTITAGCIVTLTVHLNRNHNSTTNFIPYSPQNASQEVFDEGIGDVDEEKEEVEDEDEEEGGQNHQPANPNESHQVEKQSKNNKWQKNKKKKGGGGGGGGKKGKNKKPNQNVMFIKKTVVEESPPETPKQQPVDHNNGNAKIKKEKDPATRHRDSQSIENDSAEESDSSVPESTNEVGAEGITGDSNEDDEWLAFQNEAKKENILETKSKETHVVHCPHYPAEKYEWWWLYLADMKRKMLIAGPIQVTTLRDQEEKELRFTAPPKPGTYQFTVVLRSDSYLGVDQSINVKLDVKEAKEIVEPKWDTSDDEDGDKKDGGDDSYSESDVSSGSYADDDDD